MAYKVGGEPNALLLTPDGSQIYVANSDLDEIDELSSTTQATASSRRSNFGLDRPGQRYRGANPNALALDAHANRLYVTLGGENAVAVVDVRIEARTSARIPTGWYPTSVAIYGGDHLAITDGKGSRRPTPAF